MKYQPWLLIKWQLWIAAIQSEAMLQNMVDNKYFDIVVFIVIQAQRNRWHVRKPFSWRNKEITPSLLVFIWDRPDRWIVTHNRFAIH